MKPSPQEIRVSEGRVRIRWNDAHESHYIARDLRMMCRCAACVDEWTHEVRVRGAHVPQDVEPRSIDVVGQYALQFSWSDGHATGLYTYDYLREICGCDECRTKRSFNV